MQLKDIIYEDVKKAMREDKRKLGILRLVTAAIKQIEVDEKIIVDDARLILILDKMRKQRLESIEQFAAANRQDLVDQEVYELSIIKAYLPEPLSDDMLNKIIGDALIALSATKKSDMGRVMAHIKPLIQGKADMNKVSQLVKDKLD